MFEVLLAFGAVLVAAILSFSYAYFLQCRLFSHQVKEKDIDELLKALVEYETLSLAYWAGKATDERLIITRQVVFHNLAAGLCSKHKIKDSYKSILGDLVISATGSNFQSPTTANPRPNDAQQRLVIQHAGRFKVFLLTNRYEGRSLRPFLSEGKMFVQELVRRLRNNLGSKFLRSL